MSRRTGCQFKRFFNHHLNSLMVSIRNFLRNKNEMIQRIVLMDILGLNKMKEFLSFFVLLDALTEEETQKNKR